MYRIVRGTEGLGREGERVRQREMLFQPVCLPCVQELNRVVHNMQLRVSGLIEGCQDEIILESTLLINDDLNTLFVRYDRWLKNSAAVKAPLPGSQDAPATTVGQHTATTSLMTAVSRA